MQIHSTFYFQIICTYGPFYSKSWENCTYLKYWKTHLQITQQITKEIRKILKTE